MRIKTKRILAFLCAVVLVATTVLGNWYTKQAEAADVVTPVALDGFDNLTISDFTGDGWRNQGETLTAMTVSGGEYWGYVASGLTNFDKKLVSLKVTFEGGGWQNSIIFGGNGTWVGFNLYPSEDGSQLVVGKTWGSTITSSSTPTLSATTAGVDSFIGNELLLQMSFEYGTEVDGKSDLTLGIYINGQLYNNEKFTIADCSTSANGARLAMYPQTTGQNIIIGEEVEFPVVIEPVTLDGFDNLTISDFVDSSGNEMTEGEYAAGAIYAYSASGLTNFDKKLISVNVTFKGGTYKHSLLVGGNATWCGFNLYPSEDGSQLVIGKTWGSTITSSSTPTLSATTAGVDSFIGNELLLQMSFEYGEVVDGKADLTLGIYINGQLYNNEKFTIADCSTGTSGAYMSVYCAGGSQGIIIGEEVEFPTVDEPVVIEPVTLDGFDNLIISDFVGDSSRTQGTTLTANTYEAPYYYGYAASGLTNFDKKLVSLRVTFEGGTYKNSIMFGGNGTWVGFNLYPSEDGSQLVVGKTWGSTITSSSTPTLSATTAGVDSFIGNELLLQMSFEYGEEVDGKSDLTLGIYINGQLYNNEKFTIAGCSTSANGARLAMYPQTTGQNIIIGEEVEFPAIDEPVVIEPVILDGYDNITISDFTGLEPGTLEAGGGYKYYPATDYTSLDNTLLSMNVTFGGGSYATRLDVAGKGWWSGIQIYPSNAAGDQLWIVSASPDANNNYGTTDSMQSFAIDPTTAGVEKFVGEEFMLQLAFDFGEEVNGKADLTLGVYINGNLCKSYTFTECNMAKFGNHLTFYSAGSGGSSISYGDVILSTTPDTPDTPDTPVTPGEPVELDGYDNITIKNFAGLEPGTLPAGGGYKYYPSMTHDSFDNVVLSMKVNFAGGGTTTRLDVAGTGWWSGLWLYPSNADGDTLKVMSSPEDSNGNYGTTDGYQTFEITPAEAGVTKFVDEEFVLQLAFDFGEEVNGKADLTLGVYINGNLCKTHTFTGCNVAKFGNHLTFYSAGSGGSSITYGDVVLSNTPDVPTTPDTPEGPVILDGFRNLTISDFVGNSTYTQGTTLTEGRYKAPNYYGYVANGVVNFHKKLLSLNVTFEGGGWQNSIIFGGNGQWVGFNLYPSADGSQLFVAKTWGSTITSSATPTLSAQVAGVESFVGEEFLLQMSFEYGQEVAGKADLKLGIYINGKLYNNQVFTIAGCDTSTSGARIALYPQTEGEGIIIGKEVEMPKSDDYEVETLYQKLTFDSFGIADGKYPYVSGKVAVSGTATGRKTLNETVICGDILYEGSDNSQIIWGGTSAMNGLRMNPKSDGTMQLTWYDGNSKTPIATLDSETAGVAFVGEKYSIKLSSELVDADKDGKVNDIKIGISFNGVLYNDEYFYATNLGDKYGSYFSVYCAEKTDTVTLNSAPELVSRKPNADFEKVTFEYFGLADGTYKYDGTDQSTFSGKGLETLDKKVLCGDILLDGQGRISLMVGGKSIWYGLRFTTKVDGSIQLIWVDEDGTPYIETFDSATAGTTLIGEWMNLMISTEIVDADGDGEKDDIEFGFWFNGVLYKDKYYTVLNKASRLGKCFGFDCAEEDTSVSVRSIPEYIKGFDYSIYGLTEDWKKTLLDTDFKVYTEVGGSRNPEPFTGDWTEIGKALCLFGTVAIVAIGTCVFAVLQRKKNHRD